MSEHWALAFGIVGTAWAIAWLFVAIVRAALNDGKGK